MESFEFLIFRSVISMIFGFGFESHDTALSSLTKPFQSHISLQSYSGHIAIVQYAGTFQ